MAYVRMLAICLLIGVAIGCGDSYDGTCATSYDCRFQETCRQGTCAVVPCDSHAFCERISSRRPYCIRGACKPCQEYGNTGNLDANQCTPGCEGGYGPGC